MFAARGGFNYLAPSGDPYWTSVSFLQNFETPLLSYTDSSTNNAQPTLFSNTLPSLLSPFTGSGASLRNPGASSYVTYPDNSAYVLSGDFTIEGWIYPTTTNVRRAFISQWPGGSGQQTNQSFVLEANASNRPTFSYGLGSINAQIVGTTTTVTQNAWNHVAVTRSGTTVRLFVNGTLDGTTGTLSGALNNSTGPLNIGRLGDNTFYLNGWMSNIRMVVGTALYTASFTPSTTPLTAVTNTVFLMNGTYQGTFNNTTFVDTGPNAAALTVYSTPYYSSLSPFGTTYPGSVFYNTSSALETSSTATMPSGTGAYTVEGWIYLTALPANTSQGICTSYTVGGFYFGVGRSYNGDVNGLQIGRAYQADCENCAFTWSLNTWYHVAVVRSGTTIYFFVDGVQKTTVTPSSTGSYSWPSSSGARFGGGGNASTRDALFKGYISNFRVTSSALYTSNFTPSTTPLGISSNTKVLINGSTGGFYDLSNSGQTITNSATNANISNQLYKFGSQSIAFAATGYETVLDNTGLQFGTGDFTIEGWVYRNAIGATHSIICKGATTPTGWLLQINSSNQLVWYSGSTALATSTTTIAATTWTYFAISRSGTTAYMFINGTLEGSSFTDNTNYNQTTNMFIGSDRSNANGLNGNLDDIRITKGVCRYTASFTAPTSAFPTS